MVWFFLILYLITLAECNYGFIGYSEKAFAEEKSPCTFAVASTQSGNQDPPAARAQEGVWDSPETSFARRKLFGPHCGRDGAVRSGLALLCVLADKQSQHAEVCPLWDQVDTWKQPNIRSAEGATKEPKKEFSVLELHRMEQQKVLGRCILDRGLGRPWTDSAEPSGRGNTPRQKTPKKKQKDKQGQYTMPAPEPPWHSQYRGDQVTVKPDGEDGQEASENLTLLATALVESNTPVPAKVKHIVSEHSAPIPTAKGLKTAVDKMDKARKKLKEAQKARANLHANWRKYLADSVQRWTQFAEQFGKDDQELASKVTAAQERLQSTKEDVDAKKTALEELEEDVAVEITDDDMPDKIDTAEDIQENINAMVNNLQNLQQRAGAAIVEAAGGKNKRQRIEAPDGGVDASLSAGHAPGRASTAMKPFGVPDK